MATDPAQGTPTKSGQADGPVAGYVKLDRADVAPKSGRAAVGLIALLLFIAAIVATAVLWADDAPEAGDRVPAVILEAPSSD